MPKNDNNDNLDNAEATQTPAEYTPAAVAEEAEAPVTPIAQARSKRRLGTGAIIGISAASVALLAGVFGSGIAVANVISHVGGGPVAGQPPAQKGMDGAGPQAQADGHQGKQGQGQGQGHQGGKGGGQQGGLEADGSMPGNVPHEHDANGKDIIPEGYPATAPAPATTN